MGSIPSRDTPKSLKMVLAAPRAINGVEPGLVGPMSGYCDWVWYHVKCLGHDNFFRLCIYKISPCIGLSSNARLRD